MKTWQIAYTDLDTWIEQQQTQTLFCSVEAPTETEAIRWFEENVQGDWDLITETE